MADAPLHEVTAYGERRMRAALAALPDGTWRFADVLDSSGPAPTSRHRPTWWWRSPWPATR
jgi:N-methylhydantoinase B/oxoprolinase/acetone carboxylase alpha subunit